MSEGLYYDTILTGRSSVLVRVGVSGNCNVVELSQLPPYDIKCK